jgi:DTW domain-containing protein YfiP
MPRGDMSGYCPDCGNTLCICDSETRATYPYRVKILELEAEIDELKIQDQIIAKEIKIIADNLRTVVKINQAENAKLRDALIKLINQTTI